MNKKALLFDFDGTIVDSMTRLTDVAAEVMSQHFGLTPQEARRLYLLTYGLPFNEQVESLYPAHPKRRTAVREFESTKRDRYFSEPLFKDAMETLQDLKRKNYFLAVSSSNLQELVEAFVIQKNLPFDVALGWKSAEFGKGAPHFQYVQKEFGFKSEEMIFIGDSLKDAERALSCQIDFIGKAGTFTKKQFLGTYPNVNIISNLTELTKLF